MQPECSTSCICSPCVRLPDIVRQSGLAQSTLLPWVGPRGDGKLGDGRWRSLGRPDGWCRFSTLATSANCLTSKHCCLTPPSNQPLLIQPPSHDIPDPPVAIQPQQSAATMQPRGLTQPVGRTWAKNFNQAESQWQSTKNLKVQQHAMDEQMMGTTTIDSHTLIWNKRDCDTPGYNWHTPRFGWSGTTTQVLIIGLLYVASVPRVSLI